MSNIDTKLAEKVAANFSSLSGNQQAAFDPQWIFVILDVLNLIRPMLEKCLTPSEVSAAASRPTFIQRRLLGLKIRQTLGGRLDRQHGHELQEAILKTGQGATAEEIKAWFDNQ